jgi:pSer/pThr/pTyr-binding forkhead associated (FHA) protein
MNVSLVMFSADGDRREFHLTKPRTVIGRRADCDLRIPLSSVSRQHCELTFEGGQLLLRDLGSSNGTYHNNTRVQQQAISAGDELTVGPVIFTVVIDGFPAQIKPVRTVLEEGVGGDTVGDAQPHAEEAGALASESDAAADEAYTNEAYGDTLAGGEHASDDLSSDDLAALAGAMDEGDGGEEDGPQFTVEQRSSEENESQSPGRGG